MNKDSGNITSLHRAPIFASAFTITSFQTEISGRVRRHLRLVFGILLVTFIALSQMFS